MFWGMQDNEKRIPCSSTALEEEVVGFGVNMENLHSHILRNSVDNEMLAHPSEREPLGVGIVDRVPSLHNKHLYSQSQCNKSQYKVS